MLSGSSKAVLSGFCCLGQFRQNWLDHLSGACCPSYPSTPPVPPHPHPPTQHPDSLLITCLTKGFFLLVQKIREEIQFDMGVGAFKKCIQNRTRIIKFASHFFSEKETGEHKIALLMKLEDNIKSNPPWKGRILCLKIQVHPDICVFYVLPFPNQTFFCIPSTYNSFLPKQTDLLFLNILSAVTLRQIIFQECRHGICILLT